MSLVEEFVEEKKKAEGLMGYLLSVKEVDKINEGEEALLEFYRKTPIHAARMDIMSFVKGYQPKCEKGSFHTRLIELTIELGLQHRLGCNQNFRELMVN